MARIPLTWYPGPGTWHHSYISNLNKAVCIIDLRFEEVLRFSMESGECLAPVLNRAVRQSVITRPSLLATRIWPTDGSEPIPFRLRSFYGLSKFWRTHPRHSTPSSSLRHFVTPSPRYFYYEWPLRYRSTPSNRPLRPWTTRRSIGIFPHPSPPRRVCRRYRRTAAGTSDRTGARASATSTAGARPRRRSAVCRMARSISA
jgi:hypothetical protein